MKIIVWCQDKDGYAPAELLVDHPEYQGRHIGDFDVDAIPLKGDHVSFDEECDTLYWVEGVTHHLYNNTVYIEVEYVELNQPIPDPK